MATTITITIPANHRKPTKVEVDGVIGPSCKDLTRQLEMALGAEQACIEKPEFHETQQVEQRQQQQIGGAG